MLKNGTLYQDLGSDHFDWRAKQEHVVRLIGKLENLGYNVQIAPRAA